MFQDPEYDKYAFEHAAEIDCASRVHLCKAACCRLPFALSNQDVREGIVRWDLGQPYLIEHASDGYCTHHGPQHLCMRASTPIGRRPAGALTAATTSASGWILRQIPESGHEHGRIGHIAWIARRDDVKRHLRRHGSIQEE